MPPKKIRCTVAACGAQAQRIVGDCDFCQGHFCGKHRLLEDHSCSGLEDVRKKKKPESNVPTQRLAVANHNVQRRQCKKQSHQRLAAQLESEKTTVVKTSP